jgi:hypothetical protein
LAVYFTKEKLDQIQAEYEAGNRSSNKLTLEINYDIIVNQDSHYIFDELVLEIADAMEKNGTEILSAMHTTGNFYDELAIFEQEFGSRITIISVNVPS